MSGATGSNECPAGSARIETEAACRAAAAAAGKTAGSPFVQTSSPYQKGCVYFDLTNYAFFIAQSVGTGNSAYRLLCTAAPTGAPLTRRPADARVLRGARGRCAL